MLLAESSATAADADSRVRTARTACLAGDYEKGVAILAELFVDSRDPAYIYNQARCFEQNGRYQQAINRFHEYRRISPQLSEADDASVQKHIADCEIQLRSSPTMLPAEPVPPVAGNPPAAPTEVMADPVSNNDQPAVRRPHGAGLRTAGVIVAGLGGAALISAVAFNLKVNSMATDLEAPGAYSRSTESRRSNYATLAWIGYGVGGACLAGGALLYLLGRSAARTDAVALAPTVSADQWGVSLQGAF